MTAGCAPCGDCCDPVTLLHDTWAAIMESARRDEDPGEDRVFIAEHWHPVSGGQGSATGEDVIALRCDQFDPDSRLCMARESRPPVCRGYPWYGEGPTAERGARMCVPQCSYLADLPPDQRPEGARPLIPLTVIRG